MRWVQISAMAICLGLYAGAARSASFNFYDSIPDRSSVDYTFNLDADSISANVYAPGRMYFVEKISPEEYWIDFTSSDVGVYCYTLNCSTTFSDPLHGNYMAMYSSFYNERLNIHIDSNIHGFNTCFDPNPQGVCSLAIGDASGFALRATYSGDLAGVSITRGAVPEPATWAMMIAGFGLVGATLRRRLTLSVRTR